MKKQNQKSFPRTLTKLMKDKKVGVRALARSAKVSPGSIMDWKSGNHSPTDYEAVGRVADALDVSLGFLLRGKEDVRGKSPSPLPLPRDELFIEGELLYDGYATIKLVDGYARVKILQLIPSAHIETIGAGQT